MAVADVVAELAARIEALVPDPGRRVLVGIAGPPGAGKSTLAAALTARLASGTSSVLSSPVAHVPMDGFHLADAALSLLGLLSSKGAPSTFDAAGYAALLRRIAGGEEAWAPAFERDLEQPLAQAIPVPASARFVISEGNYLLLPSWSVVRACFDEVWYCSVPEALRVSRLVARHVEFGKSPEEARAWVSRVDEPNARLVAESASSADLVVDLTDVVLTG
jgi:pantothenate kinase